MPDNYCLAYDTQRQPLPSWSWPNYNLARSEEPYQNTALKSLIRLFGGLVLHWLARLNNFCPRSIYQKNDWLLHCSVKLLKLTGQVIQLFSNQVSVPGFWPINLLCQE